MFSGLNLKIAPGEKVGLVGQTGSGTSTLMTLLLRAYDVNSGEMLIDGQNSKNVTQESLHQSIGIIPQDTSLFHRTIAENIAYGKPNAKLKDIISAAKDACADDFICEKGTIQRTEVSNAEIWCECFGKSQSDLKSSDSYQLAAIMKQIGGWERTSSIKKQPIYGRQKIYKKVTK